MLQNHGKAQKLCVLVAIIIQVSVRVLYVYVHVKRMFTKF